MFCVTILDHGALAFASSFCFESAIRYIKKKAHGTKALGSQIAFWCDIDSIMLADKHEPPSTLLLNEIQLCNNALHAYRKILYEQLGIFKHNVQQVHIYLRLKHKYIEYHSFLYDNRFSSISYLISYRNQNHQIQYGKIILFYVYENEYYVLIQQYCTANIKISDGLMIPDEFKSTLDLFYTICRLSSDFAVIQVGDIVNKCVLVPFLEYICISERRLSYEHD